MFDIPVDNVAVVVIAVPFNVIASASNVPSISASPDTSNDPNVPTPKTTLPTVPLNTSLLFVASGTNVNAVALSSKPKKPTLAADPV